MFFASDNWAGAHPKISAALAEHGGGFNAAYGAGEIDRAVERRFAEIFEHEVSVWFLPTGTAANSLAVASVGHVGGVAFAHPDAHIREDEGGAPEFLTAGMRVRPVPGPDGKMDAALLRETIKPFSPGAINQGRASAVSITQATEAGTVYSTSEIAGISNVCRDFDLPLHMDGSRFANAMVTLDCSPAEMTWRQGVDILSFGGTKNGCWCAEALIFFDPAMAAEMPYLRKRSGLLFSKNRFIAAQFLAYLEDGLWLDLARHANAMAAQLVAAIEAAPATRMAWACEANEVFAILPMAIYERIKTEGGHLYPWQVPAGSGLAVGEDETVVRMVTSFATEASEIARFAELLG
ncbi:low specificity L-threonine aldolase [Oricola sp.]|uniref:threonine aldolase family protein n=1 Tax=Oricola sp. TaxID=1979950 RepID=UPI0025DD28D0|nr:low specificity L-threonine aldolase [Oricola sp.]MCI5074693.1 low specificity L-threonine aldolase [Oricola sp.]